MACYSLIDSLEGKRTDITAKPYSFGVDEGKNTNRFFIEFKFIEEDNFSNNLLGLTNNINNHLFQANIANNQLKLENNQSNFCQVDMYDITGRKVNSTQMKPYELAHKSVGHLKSGVYLISILQKGKQEVLKVYK